MAVSGIGRSTVEHAIESGEGGMSGAEKARAKRLSDYKEALEKSVANRMAKYNEKLEKALIGKTEAEAEKIREKYRKQAAKQGLADAEELEKKKAEFEKTLARELHLQQKEDEQELQKLKEQNAKTLGSQIKNTNAATVAAFNAASNVQNALLGSVDKYLGIYSNYMSKIETRVQGLGKAYGFEAMDKKIRQNTALSPYVKYTSTLENLNKLVELGIADNLTERAFLATISEKIATTFDAAEASLLKIVRIQQQDSTASRLGMEAELTKLFNANFGDTSYLSESFDTVQAALIDVSSQLKAESAVELEYQVQKWLGSLGSVGVSSNTLSALAEGINYLGTGNINALQSNASLQNLLVMSANRANLDYSKLLSGGISAQETNALLYSVIQYVQELSSTSNNVVKQQYAELFGLTMSDMRAFQNINSQVIDQLYKNGMSYSDTLKSLDSELKTVSSRMHASEMIDNLLDNVMAATGTGIASNIGVYSTYKAFDMLESLTGGINLPFISAFGTGVDLNMSLEGLAKTGILGISAAVELINGLVGLSNGGALNLSNWSMGARQKGGYVGYQSAETLDVNRSTTNYVSSGSDMGIQQSLSDTQTETGKQVQGESTSEQDEMKRIIEEIHAFFYNDQSLSHPLYVKFRDEDPFYTYNVR